MTQTLEEKKETLQHVLRERKGRSAFQQGEQDRATGAFHDRTIMPHPLACLFRFCVARALGR